MKRLLIYLLAFLYMPCLAGYDKTGTKEKIITPMEALDTVKEQYAGNFDKVRKELTGDYFYKLSDADYYLVYEGFTEDQKYYLIHLYEFVLDDPELNQGHTVTYGWYSVDKVTGKIAETMQYYE